MGGCGSKPRVLKEIDHNTPQPLPVVFSESDHPQPQARRQLPLHEILDIDLDHQSDKRPSLSYLFHQNQSEAKAKTGSERNEEENVKEGEASDSEVKGTNEKDEGIMKQESQVIKGAEHKVSEETQNSNKAEKCEANVSDLQAEATKTSAKSSEQSEEELKPQIGH